MYMAATRTQIYLTQKQRAELDALSERSGRTLAQLIREAVDVYLTNGDGVEPALEATFGAMPGLQLPAREEWERDG